MIRANREWTTPEIAAQVAWRFARYKQSEFVAVKLYDEFGTGGHTVMAMFDTISAVIGVSKAMVNQRNVYTLTGQLIPANGKPLRPVQGAFAFAYILARDYWATESYLAELSRWDRGRVRQMVKYKLRTLPLWRRPRTGDAIWVDIDFQDVQPLGENVPAGSCTRCGWPPRDSNNLVSKGTCSWCKMELDGALIIRD